MRHGELSVTSGGTLLMLMLLADSWDLHLGVSQDFFARTFCAECCQMLIPYCPILAIVLVKTVPQLAKLSHSDIGLPP